MIIYGRQIRLPNGTVGVLSTAWVGKLSRRGWDDGQDVGCSCASVGLRTSDIW